MDIHQIRSRNLSEIIQRKFDGSNAAFSRYIDVNPTQINRIFYLEEKGGRNLGDHLARQIETKLSLNSGWLDIPHWLTNRANNIQNANPNLINNLRQAVPYFNRLSNNTIVIYIDSDIIDDEQLLFPIIQDIALLDSIGVKIVLVHGSRLQIDYQLAIHGNKPKYHDDIRITDKTSLNAAKLAVGETRVRIEGLLSLGLANSSLEGARLAVVSGNAVVGRPIGVKNGIDFQYSGVVRSIETDFIEKWLNTKTLVLLSPLAYSPTGEIYNVPSIEVATQCAIALHADKLIILSKQPTLANQSGERISRLIPNSLNDVLHDAPRLTQSFVNSCIYANEMGVNRCHLLDATHDGALIAELFTQDGTGTMISNEQAEVMRKAKIDDIAAILTIIRPLEQRGILVPRSQELIENHIEDYLVVEAEDHIVGCAALHAYHLEQIGEIACVAVADQHQTRGIAARLVKSLESIAHKMGLEKIFVLTTDTSQWFQRQHYAIGGIDDLPPQRRTSYDTARQSRIYIKEL